MSKSLGYKILLTGHLDSITGLPRMQCPVHIRCNLAARCRPVLSLIHHLWLVIFGHRSRFVTDDAIALLGNVGEFYNRQVASDRSRGDHRHANTQLALGERLRLHYRILLSNTVNIIITIIKERVEPVIYWNR